MDAIITISIFVALLILQIIMIAKFFSIASNISALRKHFAGGETFKNFRARVEVEKFLGNSDRVKEILVRERIRREKEVRLHISDYDTQQAILYLDQELQNLSINPDDLKMAIFGDRAVIEIGDKVIDLNTQKQWTVKGKYGDRLYCVEIDGNQEQEFRQEQVKLHSTN